MVEKRKRPASTASAVEVKKKAKEEVVTPPTKNTNNKTNSSNNNKKTASKTATVAKPTSKKVDKKKKIIEKEEEEEEEVDVPQEEEEEEEDNDVEEDDNDMEDEDEEKKPNANVVTVPKDSDLSYEFSSLPLGERSKQAINEMGFTKMTEIQARAIPHLISGKDLIGAAKTGSGKTLAFLIPTVEMLSRAQFKHYNGTGAIILTPTRELAMQIYGVLTELMEHHSQTHGILMGGTSRAAEKERLDKGVNILVCTPGRLLDHLTNTATFMFKHLRCLIIDEADRILEVGFEQDLRKILSILPKERQTMLFSATQNEKVVDIARLCFQKTKPVYIGVDDKKENATVETLEQGYIVCPPERRFTLLFTFLKKNRSKKIIVFMSTCNAVQFYSDLLNYFKLDLQIWDLHGQQKQQKRTTTFFEFINAQSGVLISTDVAARGLDIPQVDWIVQFDPPDDPREYIHRVGRTARNGAYGRALMFLLPNETNFLKYLNQAKVPLNEYEFKEDKLAKVQDLVENVVSKTYYLHNAAKLAYRAYLLSYATHSLKDTYDVFELDLLAVAKGFGFTDVPKLDLQVIAEKAGQTKTEKKKRPMMSKPNIQPRS